MIQPEKCENSLADLSHNVEEDSRQPAKVWIMQLHSMMMPRDLTLVPYPCKELILDKDTYRMQMIIILWLTAV